MISNIPWCWISPSQQTKTHELRLLLFVRVVVTTFHVTVTVGGRHLLNLSLKHLTLLGRHLCSSLCLSRDMPSRHWPFLRGYLLWRLERDIMYRLKHFNRVIIINHQLMSLKWRMHSSETQNYQEKDQFIILRSVITYRILVLHPTLWRVFTL